jgi:hypothetical protein
MNIPAPTLKEIEKAHAAFHENEPRDLFYRAATELVELAIHKKIDLSTEEALAVLLRTWNQAFYRYRKASSRVDEFKSLKNILSKHRRTVSNFRRREIQSMIASDETSVTLIFKDLEEILGPVGTAKSLHLLAPRFFPLWDRKIAHEYGLALRKIGQNSDRYYSFMKIAQGQSAALVRQGYSGRNVLKALDEYNYGKFSRGWI